MAQTKQTMTPEEKEKMTKLEKDVKNLKVGVWFSAFTLIVALFNTALRVVIPTYVVANPPVTNKPYWTIGPASMLTVSAVATKEQTTTDNIIKLIHDNKISPTPIVVDEHNISWAIDKKYTISQ